MHVYLLSALVELEVESYADACLAPLGLAVAAEEEHGAGDAGDDVRTDAQALRNHVARHVVERERLLAVHHVLEVRLLQDREVHAHTPITLGVIAHHLK